MLHTSDAHAKPKAKIIRKAPVAAVAEPPPVAAVEAPKPTPPAAEQVAEARASADESADLKPLKNVDISGMVYLGIPGVGTYETLSIGALLRGTYQITPQAFASGRIGFVYGLPRTYSSGGLGIGAGGVPVATTYETSFSWMYVPILAGGRYYLDKTKTGFHGDAELGLYPVFVSASSNYAGASASSSSTDIFLGINLGAGYVLPGKLPLDLMVEWSNRVGLGVSAGIPLL